MGRWVKLIDLFTRGGRVYQPNIYALLVIHLQFLNETSFNRFYETNEWVWPAVFSAEYCGSDKLLKYKWIILVENKGLQHNFWPWYQFNSKYSQISGFIFSVSQTLIMINCSLLFSIGRGVFNYKSNGIGLRRWVPMNESVPSLAR